jgi:hypothetical protein
MSEITVTQYGLEKIAAAAKHGTPLNATAMVIGDGAPTPDGIGGSTAYTIPSPDISIDPGNPNHIVAKGTIPYDTESSFAIGSIALMDDANVIAIAEGSGNIKHGLDHSYPQTYEIEMVVRLSNEASGPGPGSGPGSNGYSVYGVQIDLTDSNPEACVTYIDDAIGMVPGGSGVSEWDSMPIFRDIKPVLLVDGAVSKYLNPNAFAYEAETGLPVDISLNSPGDVMIEIPKIGYQMTPSNNVDTITIRITDEPNNPNYRYYAHTRDTEGDRDKLYIGAYLGKADSNGLRSVSGQTPHTLGTIGQSIEAANNRGDGYDIVGFYPLTLLQILYLIRSKNLDSQTAVGHGLSNAGNSIGATGATNSFGMNYGTQAGTDRVKCLGIEDFWGNLLWWIGGCFYDANLNILTAFKDFNNNGNGYVNRGVVAASRIDGFFTKILGTSETGFTPKVGGGSGTTYFCDGCRIMADCALIFGGNLQHLMQVGAFNFCAMEPNTVAGLITARLMYL